MKKLVLVAFASLVCSSYAQANNMSAWSDKTVCRLHMQSGYAEEYVSEIASRNLECTQHYSDYSPSGYEPKVIELVSNNIDFNDVSCRSITNYSEYKKRKQKYLPRLDKYGLSTSVWNAKFIRHQTMETEMSSAADFGGNLNTIHFNVYLNEQGKLTDRTVPIDYFLGRFYEVITSGKAEVGLKLGFWSPKPNFSMFNSGIKDYTNFLEEWKLALLRHARFAEKYGIKFIDILYEFDEKAIGNKYEDQWKAIILELREVYSGEISINVTKPWQRPNKAIMANADIVQTSFHTHPKSKSRNPSQNQIERMWFNDFRGKNFIYEICKLSKESGKKVLIGDVGFASYDGSTYAQSPLNKPPKAVGKWIYDPQEQVDQINAALSVLSMYPEFIQGISMLEWYPMDALNHKDDLVHWDSGARMTQYDWTFKGKPSEDIVRDWFQTFERNNEIYLSEEN